MSEATWTTAYGAAAIINEVLSDRGVDHIRPQMVYNYTKARVDAGKASKIKFAYTKADHKFVLSVEDSKRWADEYADRKLAGAVVIRDEDVEVL